MATREQQFIVASLIEIIYRKLFHRRKILLQLNKKRGIIMENEFRMVILFGGNEYEVLDEDIKGRIGCIMLPAVMRSTMGKSNEVLCRVIEKEEESK